MPMWLLISSKDTRWTSSSHSAYSGTEDDEAYSLPSSTWKVSLWTSLPIQTPQREDHQAASTKAPSG